MALGFLTKTAPLGDQLEQKRNELQARNESQIAAARSFTEAAGVAAADADTAKRHAAAVQEALTILDQAGVEL